MRDIELRLTADLDGATKEVAGFRKEYGDLVKVVEKPLRQVNAFRDLEKDVVQTGKAMRDARDRIRELSSELIKSDVPSRQLQDSYKASVRELQRLERAEATQVSRLQQMQSSLRDAGVDTRNLSAEQRRLSVEYSKALAAGRAESALSSAKSSLGASGVRDTQQALVKLREQYALVKSSGELSSRDLGIAQANYRRSVSETLTKLRELRSVNAAPVRAPVAATKDPALQNLGINRLKELRLQLATATADYQRLTRAGVLSASERSVAETQYRKQLDQTRKAIAALKGEQASANKARAGTASDSGLTDNITLAGAGLSAIALGVAYLKTTDVAKKMEAQLRLATSSQEEYNEAQRATFVIAQRNQAPLEGVVQLYSQLAPALAQMGRGQKETLGVIDAVTQSLRISGATASETASTVLQFSQALGSGVLRGDEFNSIAENSPRLLRALADGLKVPTGALRAMAAEGKLTADVIVDVLLEELPKLTAEAKTLPETWGGAFEQLKNQILVSTKQMDDFVGISNSAVSAVQGVTAAIAKLSSGEFGDYFRSAKTSVGGFSSEISVALARIRDLVAARSKLNVNDKNDKVLFDWKLYTQAQLDSEIAGLNKSITDAKAARDKLAADQGQGNSDAERAGEARLEAARAQSTKLKAMQTDLIADTKKGLKEQVAAERAATSAIKKAKDEQLDTQKKYAAALSGLQGGGNSGEPSYGNAQALKVGARQALQNGDVDGAKKKAEASLEILQKLADAGGNTLGFAGFIKELQSIETAADGINVKKAEDSLKAATDKTADLKARLDELKNVQITPTLSEEAVAAVIKQMQDLKAKLGLAFNVPVTVKPTDEMQAVAGQSNSTVSFPTATAQPLTAAATAIPPAATPTSTKLKYQAGVTDYSQRDTTVQVAPVLEEDYYQKLVREVAAKGPLPVPVQPAIPDGAVENLDVPVTPAIDQASVAAAQSQIAEVASQMRQVLTIPVTVLGGDVPSVAAPSADLPGYAGGDMVRGPGSGTSDSILAMLSNGEFVMKTAAVQHYGPEFLRMINDRRFPRFAQGGSVGPRSLPNIPAVSGAIQQQLNPVVPEPLGHVSMNVGGETYNFQAPQQDFQRLIRNQRIKYGRT